MLFYDHDILTIDKKGILLKNKKTSHFVDFTKCCNYRAKKHSNKVSSSVGSRDITKYVFTFCDNKNQNINIVVKKRHILDFSRQKRFIDLQKTINALGYTTLDLS